MALLNPIVSKQVIAALGVQEVYVCPPDKSHAIVDLSFYKDDMNTSSLIAVALSTESNPANLTSVDYFIDDIELINEVNSGELNKVVVGQGERLFVKVLSGSGISVRVSGMEETNPKVIKAGRLAATSVPTTDQVLLFDPSAFVNAAYISTSITIFNTSQAAGAKVELWISSTSNPSVAEKTVMSVVPLSDTTIIENVLILPNEKVYVRSELANTEYFLNGAVISR